MTSMEHQLRLKADSDEKMTWAKRRTDEIIAEVSAKYQPKWDAAMAKFDAASRSSHNG